MIATKIRVLAISLLLGLMEPITARASTPGEVIDGFHAELIAVMQNAESWDYVTRRDKLAPHVKADFDSAFMSRAAVGPPKWKSFSKEQQGELTATFREFTLANYAARFNGYSGQEFEQVEEQDVRDKFKFVKTRLVKAGGDNVRIDYLMRLKGEVWVIVDVFLDGTVSELALRRSEFAPVLKKQGYDGLIAMLKAKIADLEAGGDGK